MTGTEREGEGSTSTCYTTGDLIPLLSGDPGRLIGFCRTSTRSTLNRHLEVLDLQRGSFSSTGLGSVTPKKNIPVLQHSPQEYTVRHAPISVEGGFSMTLLPGVTRPLADGGSSHSHGGFRVTRYPMSMLSSPTSILSSYGHLQ
jgi:hypothetical protein